MAEEKTSSSSTTKRIGKFFGEDAASGGVNMNRLMGSQQKKVDPYNPKSGPLPPLDIEGYAIPKFTLGNCDLLRSQDDFVAGLFFGTKNAARTMLLWTTDPLPKSLLKP